VTGLLQTLAPETAVLVLSAGGITVIAAAVDGLTRLLTLRLALRAYERCRSETSDAGKDISSIARSLLGRRTSSHEGGT
jgi:hypothetical protein